MNRKFNPNEKDSLQLLTAMAEGKLPYPSIADTVPMRIIELSHGKVRFTATADKRHVNPLGGVHGGFACTVLGLFQQPASLRSHIPHNRHRHHHRQYLPRQNKQHWLELKIHLSANTAAVQNGPDYK